MNSSVYCMRWLRRRHLLGPSRGHVALYCNYNMTSVTGQTALAVWSDVPCTMHMFRLPLLTFPARGSLEFTTVDLTWPEFTTVDLTWPWRDLCMCTQVQPGTDTQGSSSSSMFASRQLFLNHFKDFFGKGMRTLPHASAWTHTYAGAALLGHRSRASNIIFPIYFRTVQ